MDSPLKQRRLGCLLWPFSLLRYFLVWPLISAWRRKTRQSLKWRLAGSHFAVVVYSILAIAAVGVGILIVLAYIQIPSSNEAASEALVIARTFQRIEKNHPLTTSEQSAILKALSTGEVAPNINDSNVNVYANLGRLLGNVISIAIIDPNGTVTASSDSSLLGKQVADVVPLSSEVSKRALSGSKNVVGNSFLDPDSDATTGAYPLVDSTDQIIGAVVIAKSKRAFPTGEAFWLMALEFVAVIGIIVAMLVGIPAIPIGIVTGLRRARAISRPMTMLASTADRLARGDLSARVVVRGQDELASLQRSFNAMADRLQGALSSEGDQRQLAEQALAANKELIANVSHELRTPVALVRAHLEAISGEPERLDDYLRIAIRETDRLEHLVEDLFALTRLEAQALDLSVGPFDAASAVREAVESLAEPTRRDAGLSLTTEIASGDLTCLGDRARVVQVLQNLIRNAIRYTHEGGIILLSAERETREVKITVRDTGIGIDAVELPHVFDRFYRADRSRNRGSGGAGLGLAIARQLVESMGGTITVDSVIDEGTAFTIQLPAVDTVPQNTPSNGTESARSTSPLVSG